MIEFKSTASKGTRLDTLYANLVLRLSSEIVAAEVTGYGAKASELARCRDLVVAASLSSDRQDIQSAVCEAFGIYAGFTFNTGRVMS